MGQIVGLLLGGVIWAYVFGWIAGKFLFKDTEPDKKALMVGLIAVFAILVVAAMGFGSVYAGLLYIPGAIGGIWLLRKDYRKAWVPDDDTFD